MLQVSPASWHARLYLWSHAIWYQFWHKDNLDWYDNNRRNTNVCYYLRAMLVYMPLVILLHAALFAAAVWVTIVLPVHLFGFSGIGKTMVITLLVAIGVSIMVGLVYGTWRWSDAIADARREHTRNIHEQGELTFWEVVGAWISGVKHRICPLVTVMDADRESTSEEG